MSCNTSLAECNNADAVCISESWLSPQIPDSAVAIPGYNLFTNDRTSAPGGGVCIYLRQTIPCTRLSQCEQPDVESLWLSLRPHSLPRSISSIILCVVYHSTANGQPENVVLSNYIRSNLDSLTRTGRSCLRQNHAKISFTSLLLSYKMQSTPTFPGNRLEFIQLIDLGQRRESRC